MRKHLENVEIELLSIHTQYYIHNIRLADIFLILKAIFGIDWPFGLNLEVLIIQTR